jgi:hypothetical protein
MASQFNNDADFWGVIRFNGVEIGAGLAASGQLAAMAIARMRGAGPTDSGVITHTGDASADDLKVVEADPPAMSVVVNPGVCIVSGMFTGIAEAVTISSIPAPVTNPRIDIIQINQSGTVSRKAGTEHASPSAPTPDADNMKLGQIALAVSMTEVENADCTDSRTFI